MRTVIDLRRPLGSIPIEDIKPDAKSRDDTPVLPVGVQAVYRDDALRNELFALLEKHILPNRRRDTGRPGMDLWAVLVMGVLKQGLRCDYDRLQDQADGHVKIRQMLGHSNLDESEYEIQNIRDNVELMTPELLREVGRLIARADAKLSKKKPGAALVGRCDSFVVETDVHHPTDFNLLRDSVRCLLRETRAGLRRRRRARMAAVEALPAHCRSSVSPGEQIGEVAVPAGRCPAYLSASRRIADRAQASLATLRAGGTCPGSALDEIDRLLGHARRFADQIDRRVLQGEKIPHGEKVFSIFEEHTRWISKGKAGKKAELGVPVCVVEDGNGFVLDHEIMWEGGDTDVAVPLIRRCLKAVPELRGCSFDRGFHSPSNRKALDDLLEIECFAEERREIGGRAGARGGTGLRGGAQEAFRSGVDDQQSGASRAGQGPAARRGRVRAGGRPLGRRPRHPSARTEPARGGAQADAATTTKMRRPERRFPRKPDGRKAADGGACADAAENQYERGTGGLPEPETASCALSLARDGPSEPLTHLMARPESVGSLPDTTLGTRRHEPHRAERRGRRWKNCVEYSMGWRIRARATQRATTSARCRTPTGGRASRRSERSSRSASRKG